MTGYTPEVLAQQRLLQYTSDHWHFSVNADERIDYTSCSPIYIVNIIDTVESILDKNTTEYTISLIGAAKAGGMFYLLTIHCKDKELIKLLRLTV